MFLSQSKKSSPGSSFLSSVSAAQNETLPLLSSPLAQGKNPRSLVCLSSSKKKLPFAFVSLASSVSFVFIRLRRDRLRRGARSAAEPNLQIPVTPAAAARAAT